MCPITRPFPQPFLLDLAISNACLRCRKSGKMEGRNGEGTVVEGGKPTRLCITTTKFFVLDRLGEHHTRSSTYGTESRPAYWFAAVTNIQIASDSVRTADAVSLGSYSCYNSDQYTITNRCSRDFYGFMVHALLLSRAELRRFDKITRNNPLGPSHSGFCTACQLTNLLFAFTELRSSRPRQGLHSKTVVTVTYILNGKKTVQQ